VHVSQLGHSFVEDAHQFVQVGDVVPVWVLHTDDSKKRVALSMRVPGSQPQESSGNTNTDRSATDNRNRQERTERQDRRGPNRPNSNNPASQPRGPRSGNRPEDRRSGSSGDSRGPRSRQDSGRRSPSSRDASENNESRSQRPVKISRPVPEKPITEAMQQGKEPLRSFGDLMQFLKKSPPTAEVPPTTPAPSDAPSPQVPTSDPAVESSPDRADTPAPGDDDVGV
jgi:predicted RNA-binding protein with RPS1 domain